MKTTTGNPEIPFNFSSRESLLNANADLISRIQERLKAKRFRVQEGDSIKLAYMRIYLQALQVQNAILKDNEIDEFQKRLEALENSQTQNGNAIYTPVFEAIE